MTSSVYIFQFGSNIKVGATSRSVLERLSAIQVGFPYKCDEIYIATFNTRAEAFFYEKEIHEKFSEYRTNGEWFLSVPNFQKKVEKIIGKKLNKTKVGGYKHTIGDVEKSKERIMMKNRKKALKKARKIEVAMSKNPLLAGLSNDKIANFVVGG